MHQVKKHWRRTPSPVRKLVVFIIGWLVVIVGILLLPLPGPGWATIFVGFAILATEFASAARVRDFLVRILKTIIDFCLRLIGRKKR